MPETIRDLVTGTDEDYCGAEPPRILLDADGREWTPGDCWCTRPEGHEGQHQCEPCAKRLGTPGWDDESRKALSCPLCGSERLQETTLRPPRSHDGPCTKECDRPALLCLNCRVARTI